MEGYALWPNLHPLRTHLDPSQCLIEPMISKPLHSVTVNSGQPLPLLQARRWLRGLVPLRASRAGGRPAEASPRGTCSWSHEIVPPQKAITAAHVAQSLIPHLGEQVYRHSVLCMVHMNRPLPQAEPNPMTLPTTHHAESGNLRDLCEKKQRRRDQRSCLCCSSKPCLVAFRLVWRDAHA